MYIIFGKKSCPQCDMAKNILDSKGIEYIYKVLDEHYSKEELLDKCPFPVRELPQVFKMVDSVEVYIGGLQNLKADIS